MEIHIVIDEDTRQGTIDAHPFLTYELADEKLNEIHDEYLDVYEIEREDILWILNGFCCPYGSVRILTREM